MRQLGQQARAVFESRYSAQANYGLLSAAYDQALEHRAATR
jgi:hypothetical protein